MNDLADPSILFRAVLGMLGCALFYTAMCRLKHMTKEATLARFRFAAVALLAAGAVLVLAATVRPDWIQLAAVSGPAAALAWMIARRTPGASRSRCRRRAGAGCCGGNVLPSSPAGPGGTRPCR